MTACLILNASYEPLGVIPLRRAVVLVLAEKAVVLAEGVDAVHSATLTLQAPAVVLLARYVKVPHRRAVPLTRRAVLSRDAHTCVYCGLRGDTLDHVVPRSRGGVHTWTNVVTACARCNHKKADRLLSEIGWALPFTPSQPTGVVSLLAGRTARVDPAWEPYLSGDWRDDGVEALAG